MNTKVTVLFEKIHKQDHVIAVYANHETAIEKATIFKKMYPNNEYTVKAFAFISDKEG